MGDDYNELYECEESIPPNSAPFTQQSPPIPSNRVPSFSVPCSASVSLSSSPLPSPSRRVRIESEESGHSTLAKRVKRRYTKKTT